MSKKNKQIGKQQNANSKNAENTNVNGTVETANAEATATENASPIPDEAEQPSAEDEKANDEKKPKVEPEDPIIKARRTKEKQMCNNMHVFLRSKQILCDLIQLSEKKAPFYTVKGTAKDENEKDFRFIIRAVPSRQNEKGNPQVEMLMELAENQFATTHPQNNTHLEFLLKNFKTGICTIEEATAIEAKEETKETEDAK